MFTILFPEVTDLVLLHLNLYNREKKLLISLVVELYPLVFSYVWWYDCPPHFFFFFEVPHFPLSSLCLAGMPTFPWHTGFNLVTSLLVANFILLRLFSSSPFQVLIHMDILAVRFSHQLVILVAVAHPQLDRFDNKENKISGLVKFFSQSPLGDIGPTLCAVGLIIFWLLLVGCRVLRGLA